MSVSCPTCGKALRTEQGMRQHHAKVHGESLPNRECSDCGSEFYDPKARLDYCDDCNPNAGTNNGNWKRAKETATCQRCDDEFQYYPSDKKGVYCPDCVAEADDFLGDHYVDVHDIEYVNRTCDYCDTDIEVLKSERKYGIGRFCSNACLYNWMSETRRGEQHPNWKGGKSGYFGEWHRARRRVLRRDDNTCQNCGMSATDLGRNPDVHHIIPLNSFEDPEDAHSLDNLIALCQSCHRSAHADEIDITPPPSSDQ